MAIDKRIRKIARQVTNKRPRTVIDHIIQHGFITTEELKGIYGYNHPPRAARDVREEGIPLETFRVKGSDGRLIAAYRFGNPDQIQEHKLGGRKVFSNRFKAKLVAVSGSRCAITGEVFDKRYLQIDHRIPYEIAGDETGNEAHPEKFMLLSGAVQRQKSWSCEHCENLLLLKDIELCKTCYWAFPESYSHIALEYSRQVDIIWKGEEEVSDYERVRQKSLANNKSIQEYIKERLRRR